MLPNCFYICKNYCKKPLTTGEKSNVKALLHPEIQANAHIKKDGADRGVLIEAS
jgi:hypothetical protein